ncbi:hypothetical protein [Limnofasciculus baicalensis]|uniref:Uncharacterized protein n=1 Tax=Limnofasciculus baicalensis BBK-W-15 TaxID=2699891 RepID=A0AAE3KP83_9CYAN|nr:hypothetical protein [Limnofasciculus baicalensis]MCP2731295.1 hypothetical protein [Limnofasciculus baicalensis BBK-W-15]
MNNRKWLNWAIGLSIVGSGAIANPGNALPPNQSDITGTNVWNNTSPIFEEGGEIDPEILAKARSLDRGLKEAASRCPEAFGQTGPRRFAREPGNANPNCMELKRLVEESRVFLEEVKRDGVETASGSRNRLW